MSGMGEHLAQHKAVRAAAVDYMGNHGLTLIPICSHDHEGMDDYHVDRCKTAGKTPFAKGWSASKLEDRRFMSLEDMKKAFRQNRYLNIGLVLGQTDNYNIVGVDIDGELGLSKWDELAKNKEVPLTWEFWTGGGGYRLLFALPKGLVTKKHKITLDGNHQEIAFICQGQQTLVPPSVHHTGLTYDWIEGRSPADVDLAPAPDWIIDKVIEKEVKTENTLSPKVIVSADPVTQGQRSDIMTKQVMSICKSMYSFGRESALAAAKAMGADPTKFNPPMEEYEVIKSFEGAWNIAEAQHKKQFEKAQDKEKYSTANLTIAVIKQQQEQGKHYRFRNDRQVFMYSTDNMGPWTVISEKGMIDRVRYSLTELYGRAIGSVQQAKKIVEELRSALITDIEIGHSEFEDALGKDGNPFTEAYYQSDTIAVRNGIFNWRTNKLVPWNPSEHYHSLGLDIEVHPEQDYTEDIAKFNEYVLSWVETPSAAAYLQEYIGYCLTPDCSRRQFTFLLGKGSNGKSIFLELITSIFGRTSQPFALKDFEDSFFGGLIVDKYLLYDPDMDSSFLKQTGALKTLVSGEVIKINEKYEKPYVYKPIGKFLFNVNTLPKMGDTSDGLMSRLNIIHFPNKFAVDPQFKRNMEETYMSLTGRSILFAWALEGLRRLTANNQFTKSDSMEQAREQFAMTNDHIKAFLHESVEDVTQVAVVDSDRQADICLSVAELYGAYTAWCADSGEKPRANRNFVSELRNRDYIIKPVYFPKGLNKGTRQAVVGIKLTEVAKGYTLGESIKNQVR